MHNSKNGDSENGGRDMDENIVEVWLRRDPVRWAAGALGGLFAGVVMMGLAMVLSMMSGNELWYPTKIPAIPIVGPEVMQLGIILPNILAGLAIHELTCMILGILYAQFTGTNTVLALFGAGLTWGLFSWIFVNNLFSPSWTGVLVQEIPAGVSFFLHIAFGIALMSVGFFDSVLRRATKSG